MLGRVHTRRQLHDVVVIELVRRLKMLHELLSLIHKLLLMHLLVAGEFFVALPQVGAEMPEYRAPVDELKLLPLILIRHFAGALLRTLVAVHNALIQLETIPAAFLVWPLVAY